MPRTLNTFPVRLPTRSIRRVLIGSLVLSACLALNACGTIARISGHSNSITITSTDETRALSPAFTTAVYHPVDPQTADVFLSDIPLERLRDPKDALTDPAASGNILHLHVFLVPSAGDTPIDETACNLTLRHFVLAGTAEGAPKGQLIAGLYSGGGFVLPSGSIGDDSIGGSVSGSSHRLVKASSAFKDPLGSGAISGRFDAVRDDEASKAIAARMELLTRNMKAVAEKPEAEKPEKAEKPADVSK